MNSIKQFCSIRVRLLSRKQANGVSQFVEVMNQQQFCDSIKQIFHHEALISSLQHSWCRGDRQHSACLCQQLFDLLLIRVLENLRLSGHWHTKNTINPHNQTWHYLLFARRNMQQEWHWCTNINGENLVIVVFKVSKKTQLTRGSWFPQIALTIDSSVTIELWQEVMSNIKHHKCVNPICGQGCKKTPESETNNSILIS